MSGRRVLVPLTYGLSVRYSLHTGLLTGLAEVCRPVIGLGWDDPELSAILDASGLEVLQLPRPAMTMAYRAQARRMDLLHERRLASPTGPIRRARHRVRGLSRRRAILEFRALQDRLAVARPGGAASTAANWGPTLHEETNLAEFEQLLVDQEIDCVLSVTPYHDQDVLALVAAHELGLSSVVSVISFDNPTVRGRLPVAPDRVLVWNRFNADEVLRSHPDLAAGSVQVIGAPQFDLHRQERLLMQDAEWRQALGLPPDRPILLWGAGPGRLVPDEHRLVAVVDRAISAGELPGNPFLLVRRHPVDDPQRWADQAAQWSNAIVATPWASSDAPMRSWPSLDDLRLQMSSLHHSAVHINVCSSMTVDGAMFDRPQVGPAFLPGAPAIQERFVRDFYRQEHWRPIERSGGLALARDEAQLVHAIRSGLEHPDALSSQRSDLVHGVLTWADGRSTNRLIEQVAATLDDRRP